MRSKISICTTAVGLFAALAAQGQPQRYQTTDLGTLGGADSYAYGINNAGLVAGGAATKSQTGGLSQTAFLWSRGRMINLGTLDGSACPNCNSEGSQARASGEVALLSETSKTDPKGEDFCGFGTHRQCLAALWKEGHMTALPTLPGGQNASVIWMNDSGEGVGYSENGTPDSDCIVPFQVRRFAGAKWTREGKIQELRPLPGDTVSFAFGINDRGQTVGVSGLCSNVSLPGTGTPYGPHATLWDSDGSPVAIGTLPTGVTTMPTSINNRGEVVGNVQFPDGSIHPFLWSKQAGMRDLGVAAGDFVTIVPCCGSISNRGEMVGFSCGPNGCRAVVYSDQGWVALNKLTLPGSPLDLQFAVSINDAGQIAGWGATADGDTHAFLVRPAQTKADGGRKDEAVTSRSIQLDGTQSTSADGKDLTYVWTIPRGYPSAAISGATTATPTVQFSLTRGTYVFKLTVIDSTGTTSTDLVTVNFVGN